MGCIVSKDSKPSRYAMKRSEELELNGKAKFLAFPVIGDVINPVNEDRWLVIAFSPQNYYGLIIIARNVTKNEGLLVKDVTDQQLIKEKEAQQITMSWNLLFKGISLEIPKINHGGAKADFCPNGTINMEIKITIGGSIAHARKIDFYRFTLQEVDPTPSNLFKYIIDPISIYYCKKKSEMVDRNDLLREKLLSQLEALTLQRLANISSIKAEMQNYISSLERIRKENELISNEVFTEYAKSLLSRYVIIEKTPKPLITSTDPFTRPIFSHTLSEFLTNVRTDSKIFSISTLRELEGIVKLSPASFVTDKDILKAILQCESSLDAINTLAEDLGGNCGVIAAYLYLRFVDLKACKIDYNKLCLFIISIDSMYKHQPRQLWGSERVISFLGLLLFILTKMASLNEKNIALSAEEWFCLITAAYCMDVNHPGYCNKFLCENNSFIGTLYLKRSPAERHAAALTFQNLRDQDINIDSSMVTLITNFIVCTDTQLMPTVESLVEKRLKEIFDYSRNSADRALAGGMLLHAVDIALIYSSLSLSTKWCQLQFQMNNIELAKAQEEAFTFEQQHYSTVEETFETTINLFPSLKSLSIFE